MSEVICTQEKDQFNICELSINELKWLRHYQKLCKRGQERASTRNEANLLVGYVEDHHIHPKCMGGSNNRSNMTFLTAAEHFVAHQLLAKIFPLEPGLIWSCICMCADRYGNRVNNKLYSWIKQEHANQTSIRCKGTTKETDERCQKISKKNKGVPKPKVSIALKGRNMTNDESMRIRAENAKGRPNPKIAEVLTGRNKDTHQYLKDMSDKRKLENKENCSRIQKFSETIKGRNKTNTDYCVQISETINILTIEERKELVLLKDSGMQLKKIHNMFLDRGIKIAYTTLSNTYFRVKKDMERTNIYD